MTSWLSRPCALALAAALLAACGPAAAEDRSSEQLLDRGPPRALAPAVPAPVIPAGAPKVAFLGDSITAGLHLPQDVGFPAVVQRLLAARELPFELVLAGVSGDTSAGGLRRIDWVLKSKPDVVIIELGGNDGLRGKPVDDIKANLAAIVQRVRAAGARPVLLGMLLPPNYGQAYTTSFSDMYEQLAHELELDFVPGFMRRVGMHPELMLGDMLHPNADGHAQLAEVLEPLLAQVLRAVSS
ncbi:MAG: arylesterase [Planctomycetota bacterium]|nr:MAG: arylesterase [Planctomycetota bacterium]